MKTIESIDRSIRERKAKVFTASEIKEMIRSRKDVDVNDVDIVTCGTFGIMSGTMAILSVPVSDAGVFGKADTITFNGVPGIPGPCPNESLGIVDCVVYGTSKRDVSYGGGHLFKDMVERKTIDIRVTSEDRVFRTSLTLNDMPFARMVVTRGAFRNYTAFVNPGPTIVRTIFSVTGMKGNLTESSVSGCGEINPLQNDANGYLREGTPILLNGAPGMVMGEGTRSSETRRNLSAFADMKEMDPDMMGGFVTSAGPECLTSFVAAIPVTDEISLNGVSVLDKDIEIPVADIRTRTPRSSDNYASVWSGTGRSVTVNKRNCVNCSYCNAEEKCPVGALKRTSVGKGCIACGACSSTCVGKVFSIPLGHIRFDGDDVPITLRQSDRNRAEELCNGLKRKIKKGEWRL